jgi:hypothetical protein
VASVFVQPGPGPVVMLHLLTPAESLHLKHSPLRLHEKCVVLEPPEVLPPPLEPELEAGHTFSKLPDCSALQDFSSRHASWSLVYVPSQIFAHACLPSAAGAPHFVAFASQRDVQSAVGTGVEPGPDEPPPAGLLVTFVEHAADVTERIVKESVARARNGSKARDFMI